MKFKFPILVQSYSNLVNGVPGTNATLNSEAQQSFGKAGMLEPIIYSPPIKEKITKHEYSLFGSNSDRLTIDENENLIRYPYVENPIIETTLFTCFTNKSYQVNKSFYGYTGRLPHYYKIFDNSFGPYANKVSISFNGTINDSLFVYSGADPTNPDEIFTNIIPANTKFHIVVKNITEPESFISGTININSESYSINFLSLIDEPEDDNMSYALYSYNENTPNIKNLIGEYSYDNIPQNYIIENNLIYEFNQITPDYDSINTETIILSVTTNQNFHEYSSFIKIPAEYVLLSERIFIDKNTESSWYTWNNNICTINHNLDGIVNFIICERGINEIKNIDHQIINGNSLSINFENLLTKTKNVLLSNYETSETSEVILTDIIQFELYDLELNTNIEFYKYIKNEDDTYSTILVDTIKYGELPATYKFEKDIQYLIYAKTDIEDIDTYFELIIWKIDEINSKWKKNVFTMEEFNKDDVDWQIYTNDDPLADELPFRFNILGYTKQHSINNSNISNTTLNTSKAIEQTFQFNLSNNKLKVLTPNLDSKDDCENIYFYTSILSKTINVNFNENSSEIRWKTIYGSNGYELNTVKIIHNMSGIVDINIRNVRPMFYDTYILDENTIQIVFTKPWKPELTNFNIDLYLIRKVD